MKHANEIAKKQLEELEKNMRNMDIDMFHLGNKIVSIEKKINAAFDIQEEVMIFSVMKDILFVIDEIRKKVRDLNCRDGKPIQYRVKQAYEAKIICTSDVFDDIKEFLNEMEVSYELKYPTKSNSEC